MRDRAVFFKLWVMDSAAKSGRLPIVEKVDPSMVSALDGTVFFKQDLISGRVSAYDASQMPSLRSALKRRTAWSALLYGALSISKTGFVIM